MKIFNFFSSLFHMFRRKWVPVKPQVFEEEDLSEIIRQFRESRR